MNPPSASSATKRRARAYFDLEPKVRDLTLMAELARYHVLESFGSIPVGETKEEHRERSTALFAIVHLEEMVRDLEGIRRRLSFRGGASRVGSAIVQARGRLRPPFCLLPG
jgi:hypothetical protein